MRSALTALGSVLSFGLVMTGICTAIVWMSRFGDGGLTSRAVTGLTCLADRVLPMAVTFAESAAVSLAPSERSMTMMAAGGAACGNADCWRSWAWIDS